MAKAIVETRGWASGLTMGKTHLWVRYARDVLFTAHCKGVLARDPLLTSNESIRCKNCLRSIEAFRGLHLA